MIVICIVLLVVLSFDFFCWGGCLFFMPMFCVSVCCVHVVLVRVVCCFSCFLCYRLLCLFLLFVDMCSVLLLFVCVLLSVCYVSCFCLFVCFLCVISCLFDLRWRCFVPCILMTCCC